MSTDREKQAGANTAGQSELIEPLGAARQSQRYPYTFACDYLRMKVGNDYDNGPISRAAASSIQSLIADAIGTSKEEISKALAEKYLLERESL